MDALDIALMQAWDEVCQRIAASPKARAAAVRRFDRVMQSQLAMPLRSWSLVLRANDSRLDSLDVWHNLERTIIAEAQHRDITGAEHPDIDGGQHRDNVPPTVVAESARKLRLDYRLVQRLCSPLSIGYPGVSITEAAAQCGVTRQTIWRWAGGRDSFAAKQAIPEDRIGPLGHGRLQRSYGPRLIKDVYINDADRKRDEVRVWSSGPIDPGGDVQTHNWGTFRQLITRRVPKDFRQMLVRIRRVLRPGRGGCSVWQWVCPPGIGCGESVYKLYWPQSPTRIMSMFSAQPLVDGRSNTADCFLCRRCADLIYESSEAHWKPGEAGAAISWDRFIQRLSDGMLRGADVVGEGTGQ